MKKKFISLIAALLCVTLVFPCNIAFAAETNTTSAEETQSLSDKAAKVFYDTLNDVVEFLVKAICTIYPNPQSWKDISEYDSDEIGFMAGRENYATEVKDGNRWSLGYASSSLVPDDILSGKYNLGRDLLNKYAQGVYDDMRIRVSAIDDGSGDGLVVLGAIDALGVTSTDIRTIRKAVLAAFEGTGTKIASINITSTHSHSALDTQGVSTEFFKKLFLGGICNVFGTSVPGLETADSFKTYFINKSVEAVIDAVCSMETGELYYTTIDCSEIIKDKRGLISKENIPDTAVLYFTPDSGNADTYIADISCHPTSFSANNGLVSSDYIYHLGNYIKSETGANFIMVAGALGQLSRDISVSTDGMDEYEAKGASAKCLGEAFGKLILAADDYEKLSPVLNARHKEIFVAPENSILTLACEINLVNNAMFTDGTLCQDVYMATEIGYLEFGNKVAFALFPGELYPEVFWGDDITGNATWDDSEWQYAPLSEAVDSIEIHCVSLANDAMGYVLTDNNFAFMGHIIGDGIADEVLSVGKHAGSFLASNFLTLIDELK